MDRALLQRHLAMAEYHVVLGEQHVLRQHEIIARLERAGCGQSETANTARELLHQMEHALGGYMAECDWLVEQLRK